MRLRFHWNQDSVAGLMFIAWGAAGLWLARDYPVGSALRMGPGYMPSMLCWLMVILGAVVALKGAAIEGAALERWTFRPLVLICSGFLIFAFLIESAGLPAATIGSMLVGALGSPEFRVREQVILAVCTAAAAVGIFIYGLGLPMDIWPRF
jgi:putative tricarboxylic transport membrane protein